MPRRARGPGAKRSRGLLAAPYSSCASPFAMPLTASPLTGDPGATVGAVVAALLCLALAAAIWPARWIPAEVEHHRVDSICDGPMRGSGHPDRPARTQPSIAPAAPPSTRRHSRLAPPDASHPAAARASKQHSHHAASCAIPANIKPISYGPTTADSAHRNA